MAKGKFKVVVVKKTTNNITQAIINFLISQGHWAYRVNSTGVWDPVRQVFRAPKNPGHSDIGACLKTTSGGPAIALYVEVKFGKDKPRDSQIEFCMKVNEVGGIWCWAKDAADFEEYYFSTIKPILDKL